MEGDEAGMDKRSDKDRAIRGAAHLARALTASWQRSRREVMTYNRTEASIAGEHCRFCGDAKGSWSKTPL